MGPLQGTDIFEAIQHPLRCFRDDTLRRGQPLLDVRGKPLARNGRSADVYQIRCPGNRERWAAKCFRGDVAGLQHRYHALNEHLLGLDVPCLVRAEYLDQGMCIRGRWFPIVKMRWVDGQPLNHFVREHADQPQVLTHLADLWTDVASQLRRAGVAHGNLNHDHVLVSREASGTLGLRLIDYDGIWVPALARERSIKVGHPNFQHPQRLWQKTYDSDGDRFGHLVASTALRALAVGGAELWERFDHGDNLLFQERDFQEPPTSAVFQCLWRLRDPAVRALVGRLLLACKEKPTEIPLLEEIADGSSLTAMHEQQINAILGTEVGRDQESFDLTTTALAGPAEEDEPIPTVVERNGSFDLVLDDEAVAPAPAKTEPPPLPASTSASVATAIFDKAAIKTPPGLLPVLTPVAPKAQKEDANVAVYHLEAWMPEQVAVMKLQGFVRAEDGEVVESGPGLVRVHLLDRYYLPPDAPAPGLLMWLGVVQPPRPETRLLAELELQLRYKGDDVKRLLDIDARIRPGDGPFPGKAKWRSYCDRLFCSLRGYLMG
jgi:hypothetical protein